MGECERQDYTGQVVKIVRCIVWCGSNITQALSSFEKRKRQKLRDEVGNHKKEIPMLDAKMVDSNKEFCDMVLYTDRVNK
jgi:hypothetical protein